MKWTGGISVYSWDRLYNVLREIIAPRCKDAILRYLEDIVVKNDLPVANRYRAGDDFVHLAWIFGKKPFERSCTELVLRITYSGCGSVYAHFYKTMTERFFGDAALPVFADQFEKNKEDHFVGWGKRGVHIMFGKKLESWEKVPGYIDNYFDPKYMQLIRPAVKETVAKLDGVLPVPDRIDTAYYGTCFMWEKGNIELTLTTFVDEEGDGQVTQVCLRTEKHEGDEAVSKLIEQHKLLFSQGT